MVELKNIKIEKSVWKKVYLLRIQNNKKSISDMIKEIVEKYESI